MMFVPINHGHKDSTVCTKRSVHMPAGLLFTLQVAVDSAAAAAAAAAAYV
jgi:hypothetical protein